jgi:hypothetical protein
MPSLTPHIASSSSPRHQNVDRNRLARIRRWAKRRGHRVLKDWTGQYSLVDANVEPPRALAGLEHASLSDIEVAVTTPPPPPRPSRKRQPMARLEGNGSPQSPQASHPGARSFEVLIDLLNRSAS